MLEKYQLNEYIKLEGYLHTVTKYTRQVGDFSDDSVILEGLLVVHMWGIPLKLEVPEDWVRKCWGKFVTVKAMVEEGHFGAGKRYLCVHNLYVNERGDEVN